MVAEQAPCLAAEGGDDRRPLLLRLSAALLCLLQAVPQVGHRPADLFEPRLVGPLPGPGFGRFLAGGVELCPVVLDGDLVGRPPVPQGSDLTLQTSNFERQLR